MKVLRKALAVLDNDKSRAAKNLEFANKSSKK
jgi:hypothetical protein